MRKFKKKQNGYKGCILKYQSPSHPGSLGVFPEAASVLCVNDLVYKAVRVQLNEHSAAFCLFL